MMNEDNGSSISALLAQARAGDAAARDRLFALCRNYVAIVARTQVESWVRAKFDPSDLVQQTLLEAHRAFASFHGQTGAEWLGWLRGILTHNALDFARQYGATQKRQVHREVPLRQPASDSTPVRGLEPVDPHDSPSKQLLLHERELLLADALAQLSPEHREVILLRNLQGLSFEEVAERMGRSRPAAQMLWMRALHKLQALLQEQSGSRR
jgi:RNA polymerase sigma-70 factor (ECF subfamily)